VETARRQCGAWEPQPAPPRTIPRTPHPPAGRSHGEAITRPAAALEYAVRMTAGPDGDDDDRYPAKLVAVVLGDESGSRLYWALVDSGDAEHASLHHHDFLDAGLFATQLSCAADDVEPLLGRIVELYDEAGREGITARELEQARNKLAGRVVLAGERPRRRLFGVGLEWAHSGRYRSVADDLAIVEGIGLGDVHRVLERFPLHGPSATVLAGPHAASSF
jgi:predicted Zn-dependent peptidase